MSRIDDDIPEVFRRAMRGDGWDDNAQGPPGTTLRPGKPLWANRWFWVLLIGGLFFLSFDWLVTTYTQWLWFQEVHYQSVWLKQLTTQLISFLLFFVVAGLLLWLNWHIARRASNAQAPAGFRLFAVPGMNWLINGLAFFLALALAEVGQSQWKLFLSYFYQVDTGRVDPIFGRDLSFYFFSLPVYHFVQGWLIPLFFLTMLGVALIYTLNNTPSLQNRRIEITALPRSFFRQEALLLAIFCFLWVAGYHLNQYDLLYSSRGIVFGASYTDLKATLPALQAQTVTMILLALSLVYTAYRPTSPRPVLITTALWLIVTISFAGIYPGLLQRYAVEPNELAREQPYIAHNIELTRFGFDLNKTQVQPFNPDPELTAADLQDNSAALQNIRLWDYRPLQQTYAQLQELRPYYQFGEIDIDRYVFDGQTRQVMLAARELDKSGLSSPSWVNLRLQFTHGYGLAMNPVDRVTPDGQPEFFIKDLPPQSTVDLQITRPEVYYGETTNDVVFVGSGLEEFSYAASEEAAVYSNYEGTGGIRLGNFLNRLIFAFRFGELNLILSNYITPDTRAMFHRQITDRVQQIAPFLWLDHDPYIVVADGRLVWMMDAYTISDRLPYSQPTTISTETLPSGLNYLRNSVKITIDAYSGEITFYLADPNDPLIQVYSRIFPDLFHPLSEMPAVLQTHIRYPEDLFTLQSNQYLIYHMTDTQVLYNKEDLWQIPMEIFDGGQQLMEPYYVYFSLPGQEGPEYILIQPFTPAGKNNMVGWMAARSDPPHYGELIVYQLPKQELIFGPIQVEGRIDQEPTISQQISLWDQRGSRVIRGNLLVIPINQGFLYVEPLYLLSDTSALPELKRVIVATGDRIAMRDNLADALQALFADGPAVDIIDAPPSATGQTIDQLILSANDHFQAAESALQNSDWATYGQEQAALKADLEQLMLLTGGSPEATPTP